MMPERMRYECGAGVGGEMDVWVEAGGGGGGWDEVSMDAVAAAE